MHKNILRSLVVACALLGFVGFAHAQLSPAVAPEGFDDPRSGGAESGIVSDGCENISISRDSTYLQVSLLYDAKNKTCQLVSGLPTQAARENLIAGFYPGSRPEVFEMFWRFDDATGGVLEKVSPEFPAQIVRNIADGQPVTVSASCDECSGKPTVRFTAVLSGHGVVVTEFEKLGLGSRIRSILPGGDTLGDDKSINQPEKIKEKDCSDAKAQWAVLQGRLDRFDCSELEASLAKLQAKKTALDVLLQQSQDRESAYDAELQKWRSKYQALLKNGLSSDTYRFDPPADAKKWNHVAYDRHGVQVWFKGQGQEMHQFYKDNAADIKEIKQNIERALKNKSRSGQDIERIQRSVSQLQSEIGRVTSEIDDCKKKRSELEAEMVALQQEHADCVQALAVQAQIKERGDSLRESDVIVQDAIREQQKRANAFKPLDDEIETLKNEGQSKNTLCEEIFSKQVEVTEAMSAAQRARKQAADEYDNAQNASRVGDVKEAQEHMVAAEDALKRAQERVTEVKKLVSDVLNAQKACKNALVRDNNKQESERAAAKDDSEDDVSKDDDQGDIDVSSAVKVGQQAVHGAPYTFTSQTKAMGNVFLALKDAAVDVRTSGDDPCDCPWKSLFAAGQYIGNAVGTTLIKDLGIGIMRAPIDAVNPGTTAGRVAQWVSSNALTAVGAGNLSDASLAVLQRNVVSKILPKTGAGVLDKPASRLANTQVSQVLKESGVSVWTIEGRQQVNNSCGTFGCNVSAVMMYNPHTRSMVVLLRSSCCSETIMVDYTLDEKGIQATSPNITVLY